MVDLRQPGSENTRALGAELLLHTSNGILRRTVQAAGGYLSGLSARQHFGLPENTRILAIEIRWPDRSFTTIRGLTIQPDSLLTIVRTAAPTE
jgi:hypothetical protein